MPKKPAGVLSLGILIVLLAVSAIAFVTSMLFSVSEVFALTLVLFGFWVMILAGLRVANPGQYGGGVFTTFTGGVLVTTLGALWLLYVRNIFVEYILAMLLLVVGVLIAVSGIRAWRK